MSKFQDLVQSGATVFLDGAMGTYIQQLGGDLFGALNNLDHPELVRRVHDDYLAAGSQVLTTNTFSLNDIYMDKKDFGRDKTRHSLERATDIACQAAAAGAAPGRPVFVLGDLGPCGELFMRGKSKNYENEAVVEAYARQVETMGNWPVDVFLIETVFDLTEAGLILEGCRAARPDIPVIVSMTFATDRKGGATLMGNRSADIAAWADAQDILAIGANCGDLTPQAYAEVLREYRTITARPILIQPNAGMPFLDADGNAVYPMEPEVFADQMVFCKEAGATLLGGCCGTNPEHIRALIRRISSL